MARIDGGAIARCALKKREADRARISSRFYKLSSRAATLRAVHVK